MTAGTFGWDRMRVDGVLGCSADNGRLVVVEMALGGTFSSNSGFELKRFETLDRIQKFLNICVTNL